MGVILVVEDQEVLAPMLEAAGFEVQSENKYKPVRKAAHSGLVAVVVFDLSTYDVDAWDVFGWLKNEEERATVVAVGSSRSAKRVLRTGADEFVEKPVDEDALIRIVKTGAAAGAAERRTISAFAKRRLGVS